MKWVTLSILAALALSVHALAMAKMTKSGFQIGRINLNVFLLVVVIILIQQVVSGKGFQLPTSQIFLVTIAALAAYAILQLSLMAVKSAPNPGYVSGIINSSTVIISIASVYLFNAHFSLTKSIGILLCLIGVYLISK